jgi:hypothetical protein
MTRPVIDSAGHWTNFFARATILLVFISWHSAALACACCTSDGQRRVASGMIDDYAADQLAKIRFAANAELFTGEEDAETIKGIKVKSGSFLLLASRRGKEWIFAFTDNAGGAGTLTFTMPGTLARFEIDPRMPKQDAGKESGRTYSEPVLYKEWRLSAPVRATGMLADPARGDQKITLVLHGRGNSCTEAAQFTAWTIILESGKTANTIFGQLLPPN